MIFHRCMLLLLLFTLSACGAKGTTVVLIDDLSGQVGKVEIGTAKGSQLLQSRGESSQVASAMDAPDTPRIMTEEEIRKKFQPVLDAQPAQPKHFLLYFESGRVTLVPESVALLDVIAREARQSVLCDIAVIGHSDTKGAKDKNIALSLERAQAVQDLLIKQGIALDCMTLTSHGEGNLLVPTTDEVDEPKNRRVEVVIR